MKNLYTCQDRSTRKRNKRGRLTKKLGVLSASFVIAACMIFPHCGEVYADSRNAGSCTANAYARPDAVELSETVIPRKTTGASIQTDIAETQGVFSPKNEVLPEYAEDPAEAAVLPEYIEVPPEGDWLLQYMNEQLRNCAHDGSRLFEDGHRKTGLSEGQVSLAAAENNLSGINLVFYQQLLQEVKKIASGAEVYTDLQICFDVPEYDGMAWTAKDLGIESLVTVTEEGVQTSEETRKAMQEMTGYNGKQVILALVDQCMTELYWFGLGYYCGYPYEVYSDGGEYKVRMTGKVRVILSVSPDYAARDPEGEIIPYTVDAAKTERVNRALENAGKYAEEGSKIADDREKLKYYYELLSDLSAYDYEAAAGAPYGDPWQIINAFDEDPDTKVVCEGYSKAFQYLCDMTEFADPVAGVCCVTGWQTWEGVKSLPASTHMWNVVHMKDGNYLVDVTNGNKHPDLFLASCSKGNLKDGYYIPVITLAGKEVVYRYIYNEDAFLLYPESVLRLSGNETPYEEEQETKEPETKKEQTTETDENRTGNSKKTNPLQASGKKITLKAAGLQKRDLKIKRSKAVAVSKAQGKVKYKRKSVSKAKYKKFFKVSQNGRITVKKGLKKGTYQLRLLVTAAGSSKYKKGTKTVSVKIIVK